VPCNALVHGVPSPPALLLTPKDTVAVKHQVVRVGACHPAGPPSLVVVGYGLCRSAPCVRGSLQGVTRIGSNTGGVGGREAVWLGEAGFLARRVWLALW
jgi:hypothetical protein